MTSSMSRCALTVLAAIACMLGGLAFTNAAARAAKQYEVVDTFGGEGSGDGQFKEPSGVAVNDSSEPVLQPAMGDLYVIDAGNERIEQFSSTGSYISQWGGGATPAKGFSFLAKDDSQGIAIDSSNDPLDPAAGDVYVADVGNKAIDRFSATGKYEGQLVGACAAPGTCAGKEIPFPGKLRGIAVDRSGNLWVYAESGVEGVVDEFSDAGAFVTSFGTIFSTKGAEGLAVDANDDVYVIPEPGVGGVLKFEAGNFVGVLEDSREARALAVNQGTSEVLVDDGSFIERFVPGGSAPTETFGSESLAESRGIAIEGGSAERTVYASQLATDDIAMFNYLELPSVGSPKYLDVSETGVSLEGVVHPEGNAITACSFEYGTTSAYGQSVPCEQSLETINKAAEPVAVTAKLSGLAPASRRYVRLAASNANGTKRSLGTLILAPTIESESVSRTGTSEATVNAVIDPNDPNGEQTSYHVEYGTGSIGEHSTPQTSAGTGQQPINVEVSLSDLRPGSSYRFRFVALGPPGPTYGPEIAFATSKAVTGAPVGSNCPNATFTGFEPTLPDCRAYELVSLAADDTYTPNYSLSGAFSETTGEIVGIPGNVRAAEAGNAIAYNGGPTASGVGGSGLTGNGSGNNYLAVRGSNGWEAGDISIAISSGVGRTEFTNFSDDLSVQTLSAPRFPEMNAQPEPAPECSTSIQFSRTVSGLHALTPENFGESSCFASTVAISADDRHILLESSAAVTPGASKGTNGSNLFDSVNGVLHQVNVLTDGEPEADPNSTLGWYNSGSARTYDDAVSTDGSRIFWTSLEEGSEGDDAKALYVRENDAQSQSPVVDGRCTDPVDACTVQVDAAEPGAAGPSGGGRFADASRDGSKVFFTDVNRLTSNATAGPEEPDLYEYEVNAEAGASGRLTDLTADEREHADVQGVIGTSEDGSYVYFVADGVLAGANVEDRSPVARQPNLYMSHAGSTTFVTTLATSDDAFSDNEASFDGPRGDWQVNPGYRTAEVAPGGRVVGFMSTRSLTGYENQGIPEVYVYEAGSGRIFCSSCSPTGAPPTRVAPESVFEGSYVGTSGTGSFMLRWIDEREGVQVYFMSNQSLVPDDTNARQDVYEWESDGSGNCREAPGCVELLSNAGPVGNAFFMDASANGSDVFISSRSSLTPTAFDETIKVYDVRIDGGIAENRLSCTGTGCQGSPPGLPIFATPASVTFNGVGNFEPASPTQKSITQKKQKPKKPVKCKRGFVRKHGKCVKGKVKKAKKVKRSAGKSAATRKKSSATGRGR
jgi:hypothetical protein